MAKALNMDIYHNCFHLAAYNIAWICSIYSASKGHPWLGLIVAVSLTIIQMIWLIFFQQKTKHLITFILYLTLIGCIGDSLLVHYNYIIFVANPLPFPLTAPFMIGIWINFSVTFYATLQSLITHPFILGILSFFGFMIAYFFGASLGAALLVQGMKSLIILSLAWGVVLPLSITLFNRFLPLENNK